MNERLRQVPVLWARYARPIRRLAASTSAWLMGRTPRERVLLFGAVFMIIATFWQQSFFSPAATELSGVNARLTSVETQRDQLRASIERLEQRRQMAEDPDQPLREEIAALQDEVEELNQALVNRGLDFIATVPMRTAMATVQDRIEAPDAPRLISFERRPGTGITTTGESAVDDLDIRHREFRMVFEGGYQQTVAFLDSLEMDDIQLVWRSLDYEVTEYPEARITVRFDLYAPADLD